MNYSSELQTSKYIVTYESNNFDEVMEAGLKKFWYYQNSGAEKVKIVPEFIPGHKRTSKKDLCRVRVIASFMEPIIQQIGKFKVQ